MGKQEAPKHLRQTGSFLEDEWMREWQAGIAKNKKQKAKQSKAKQKQDNLEYLKYRENYPKSLSITSGAPHSNH